MNYIKSIWIAAAISFVALVAPGIAMAGASFVITSHQATGIQNNNVGMAIGMTITNTGPTALESVEVQAVGGTGSVFIGPLNAGQSLDTSAEISVLSNQYNPAVANLGLTWQVTIQQGGQTYVSTY